MPSPLSSFRPSAASGLASGSVGSGLLAYVFFATSTRGLGAADAAPVAVLWSYWGFAAAGLTFPVQHWIARTAAAAGEDAVRASWSTLARFVLATVLTTGAASWLARETLFAGDARFALLTVMVGLGAAGMGVVRGMLSARRRYAAVGALLVSENLVRCVAAGVLVALDVDDPFAYGVALVLGYAACAACASAWRTLPSACPLVPQGHAGSVRPFLTGAAGAQVISQAVLVGGPVLLAVLGGSPAEVTVLFAALALYRAPYTVLVGQVTQATGTMTRHVAAGRVDRMARIDQAVLAATAVGTVVGTVVGAWPGPWLVGLVFGPEVRVEQGVSVVLAIGSVLALANLVQGVVLIAYGRPQVTLVAWLLALAPSAVVIIFSPASPTTTIATSFVVAEGTAWLTLVAATKWARAALSRA